MSAPNEARTASDLWSYQFDTLVRRLDDMEPGRERDRFEAEIRRRHAKDGILASRPLPELGKKKQGKKAAAPTAAAPAEAEPDREAVYHYALDGVLTLFVQDFGYDFNAVTAALDALAQRPDLPVSASHAERVKERTP